MEGASQSWERSDCHTHPASESTQGLPKSCQNPGSVLASSLLLTSEAVAGKIENHCTENWKHLIYSVSPYVTLDSQYSVEWKTFRPF